MSRTVLCLLVLAGFAPAFAADTAAEAKPSAAVEAKPSVAPRTVSLSFRGSLKDGLRELAAKGGINLVVTGDLSQPCEIMLTNVSAEEALATVATAYRLKTLRQGSIWTLRPLTADEAEAAAEAAEGAHKAHARAAEPPPAPEVPDLPAVPVPPTPAVAPVPPVPPALDAEVETVAREHERKIQDRVLKRLKKRSDSSGHNMVAFKPVVVEAGTTVEDVVSYGGSVTVKKEAVVAGNAVAFGGDVILEAGSTVEGDAVAFGGQVRRDPEATVEGDEVSMGSHGLGSVVARGVADEVREAKKEARDQARADRDEADAEEHASRKHGGGVPGFLLTFALMFGLGFLFRMFAPQRMALLEAELRRDPVKCGVTGLVGAFLAVPLTVALCVTVIGIPFAVVGWLLLGLGVTMGFTLVAAEIGNRLPVFRNRKTQAVVLALGLLVLLAVGQIPVVGPLAMTLVSMLSLGAIIRTRFGQRGRGLPEPDLTAAATKVA